MLACKYCIMKKLLSYGIVILFTAFMTGCNKEENDPPECEAGGFGVARLNFGTATVAHTINAGFGNKVVPAGTISDTFRLPTGVHMIKIHSTFLSDTLVISALIIKCEERVLHVP